MKALLSIFRLNGERPPGDDGGLPQDRFIGFNKGKLLLLAVAMAFLWQQAATSVLTAGERSLWQRVRAAQQHLVAWRNDNGNATPAEFDPWDCGLIGVEWSSITTTLGDLGSKRTACNPAWAVQFSRWYRQTGLQAGDRVAIYSSGSFPGLLLSAIAAAEDLALEPLLVVSLGSSTWGANRADLPWPALASELRRAGFIRTRADFYTLGGGAEMAHGLAPEGEAALREAAADTGVGLLVAEDLRDMIDLKTRLLMDLKPGLLVNIGGAHANLGDDPEVLRLPPGLHGDGRTGPAGNGVIGRALTEKIPVVHMLNMRAISAQAGIAYDAAPRQAAPARTATGWSVAGLLLFMATLLVHRRWRLEKTDD